MNTVYSPTFPVKVISSFFDNYYQRHEYDLIKQIVYRKRKASTPLEKEIFSYFSMFQCVYAFSLDTDFQEYVKCFRDRFEESFIASDLNLNADFETFRKIILSSKNQENPSAAFFCFLMLSIALNRKYGTPRVPPVDLFSQLSAIKDEQTQVYFLQAWFNEFYPKENDDLLELLKRDYQSNASFFRDLGILNIYLFGSISKGEHHPFSDIDLAIRYEESLPFQKRREAEKAIRSFNAEHFGRKTDAIDFNQAQELHGLDDFLLLL